MINFLKKEEKRTVLFLAISLPALILSFIHAGSLPFDLAWIAIFLCGIPIVKGAVAGLVTKFDVKADVLVSIALVASVVIGEIFAAGEIAFIMQLGTLLEELTVAKAREGIEKLVHLTPQTARILTADGEKIVSAENVKVDAVVRVLPGETVPVDGVILTGHTSVNQAVMTGESLPVDKAPGDSVSSGTVNQFGAFEMKAVKVGEDRSIQRMIRLVQSADAGKAKIVGLADRWATWIVVIALSAAVLTWLLSGQIIRAVTVLVVFCPCALVLATPTAIMAAIGNATKHGFLVREGDALERLATVSAVAFDKTGTLTYGMPTVTAVVSVEGAQGQKKLFGICAAAEALSEHPLGKAVVRDYRQRYPDVLPQAESFSMIPGRGVQVRIQNKKVLAGNITLFEEQGVVLALELSAQAQRYLAQGCTLIYLALDNQYAGFIALSDTLRSESAAMINGLSKIGVRPVLLTGDHHSAAGTVAKKLHISEFHAECLPEDKLRWIEKQQNQKEAVCMIGDGINDAPALKKATVGIAMGGVGSDIAVDSADIALVDDEVKELPHLFALSKRMMTTIKLNIAFSMMLNFAAIGLAITGILDPVLGALVHNAGSVLVIINSAFLLKWRKTQ